MKKILRKLLIGIYVFLLCIGLPNQRMSIKALEEEVIVYDFVANEASGEFLQQFAQIGNFNNNGLAIVSVDNGLDFENKPTYLYGLINLEGELVLPVQYRTIRDFNDDYYFVMKDLPNEYNTGLVSKVDGSFILQPKYTVFDYFKEGHIFSLTHNPTGERQDQITEIYKYEDALIEKINYSEVAPGFSNFMLGQLLVDRYQIVTAYKGSYENGDFELKNLLVNLNGDLITGYEKIVDIRAKFELGDNLFILSRDAEEGNKLSLLKIGTDNIVQEVIDKKSNIYIRKFENRAIYEDGWYDFDNSTYSSEIVLNDNDGPLTISSQNGVYKLLDNEGVSLLPEDLNIENSAYIPEFNWYEFRIVGEIANQDNLTEKEPYTYYGYYSVDLKKVILEPKYNQIYPPSMIENGYGVIERVPGTYLIHPIYHQRRNNRKLGIINDRGEVVLESNYDFIRSPNKDGLVEFGFETLLSNGYPYITSRGVFDVTQLKVLAPGDIDEFHPFTKTMNYSEMPNFDLNGHIKAVDGSNSYSAEYNLSLEGILSRDGLIYPVEYLKAYYHNDLYYLQMKNKNWLLESRDKQFSVELSLANIDLGIDGELTNVEKFENFYVLEVSYVDTIGNQKRYGILDNNLETQFAFEYTDIKVEGSLIYLERYNNVSLKYETAVYDYSSGSFILPFGNKYESMSSYVGGIAIGQSGEANEEETIFLFGLNVNAAEDDFILDIVNKDGYVVGDLSEKYSDTLLLGQTENGTTRAMVKKNGTYYLASLQTSKVPLIPIESVTLLQSNLSLKVGNVTQLNGNIKPLNTNEPKKVIWESSDSSIVTVDGNGQIKAFKDGTATVYFKVNDYIASVVIKVGETTSSNPVSPVTPNTNSDSITQQNSVESSNPISTIYALLNQEKVTRNQFESSLRKALLSNSNFIETLSDSELARFESLIFEFYSENFTINLPEGFKIEQLLNFIDYNALLEDKPFELSLIISDQYEESDYKLIEEYVNANNLDINFVLFMNLELSINNTIQTSLNRLVSIRMKLPDAYKEFKDLKILRVHNGVVSLIDVSLLENGELSFETDRFSLYALIRTSQLVAETNIVSKVKEEQKSNGWVYIGLIAFALLSGFIYLIIKRTQKELNR